MKPQPSLAQRLRKQPSLPLQKSYWIIGQPSTSKCNNNGGQTNVRTERAAASPVIPVERKSYLEDNQEKLSKCQGIQKFKMEK